MTNNEKITYLTQAREEFTENFNSLTKDSEEFKSWRAKLKGGLKNVFSESNEYYKNFIGLSFKQIRLNGAQPSPRADIAQFNTDKQILNRLLDTMLENVKTCTNECSSSNEVDNVVRICRRFSRAVTPLQNRRDSKKHPDYTINDEQDVQDLLHSILAIYYDDVKPEEPVPSLAGSSTIIDFLLQDHGIAIEVKHTKENGQQKKFRDELLVDFANYFKHDKCKQLICFIYDKSNIIKDPILFEKDLESVRNDVHIVVLK